MNIHKLLLNFDDFHRSRLINANEAIVDFIIINDNDNDNDTNNNNNNNNNYDQVFSSNTLFNLIF